MAKEKQQVFFARLREQLGGPHANSRGITKERITDVLRRIDRHGPNAVDSVFALLDDQLDSVIGPLSKTHRFSHGATTDQIACHVGILQRGEAKLDREGRDAWIKPLRELGAIEAIQLPRGEREFVAGHPVAKNANSAYRLSSDFVDVLAAKPNELEARLAAWTSVEALRERVSLQAKAASAAKGLSVNPHESLIFAVQDYYVPTFLPGYECVYIDSDDGDRVNASERDKLKSVGIELKLSDAYPDLMLVRDRGLWCAEAVTSDGEVDEHKVEAVLRLCERSNLTLDGLTTAYRTWGDLARRQAKHKNLATDTYVWVQEQAGVHLKIESASTTPPKKKR